MSKPRLKINKPHPARWRWKNGAWRYQVPPGQEHLWDGKKEFTLGRSEMDAYKTWSERLQLNRDATLLKELFDRYLVEVVPTKAYKTRQLNTYSMTRLRVAFGDMRIDQLEPMHVYQYMDTANARQSIHKTNADVETLSHSLTKAVEWGLIRRNPLIGNLRKKRKPINKRYVADWEVSEALKVAGPMLEAYITLKQLTGLRRGDMLRLRVTDLGIVGITVRPHKTQDSSGAAITIEWTDETRAAVDAAIKARPAISPYLFCTRRGQCYVNEATGEANGFDSLWQRFMARALRDTQLQEKFQEKALRKKTASDMASIKDAAALLAHADERTTRTHYRLTPNRVKPHTLKKFDK